MSEASSSFFQCVSEDLLERLLAPCSEIQGCNRALRMRTEVVYKKAHSAAGSDSISKRATLFQFLFLSGNILMLLGVVFKHLRLTQ